MKVTLNKNSWHYKFFKFMLEGAEPPKSLCPYFWILVGLIVCSPALGIVSLIIKIGKFVDKFTSKFKKKKEKTEKTFEQWEAEWDAKRLKEKIKAERMAKIGKIIGKIFLFGIAPLCILYAFYQFYLSAQVVGWKHILTATGIVVGIIICLVGIVCAFQWFADKYFEKIGEGIVKFSIFIFTPVKWIGWMIKAGYEKACPLVEWEGEDTEVKKDYHQFN